MPTDAPHIALITGANGFLGKQLLLELSAAQPNIEIIAMVRDIGRSTIPEWLAQHRRPSDSVTLIVGDVTDPGDCGINKTIVGRLRTARVDIYHCAAHYDLIDDDALLNQRTNVDGTVNALALAERIDAASFQYMSTIAVAGNYHGVWTEEHLHETSSWRSEYGRTKHQAEQLVRESKVRVRNVFRLGVLIGDSTSGSYAKLDGLYRFLPALNALTQLPRAIPLPVVGWGAIPLCPVDQAARAIVAIASDRAQGVAVHHVFEDEVLRADDIMRILIEAAGPRRTTQLGWLGHVATSIAEQAKHDGVVAGLRDDIFAVISDLGVPRELLGELNTPTRYSNATTARRLARLGIASTRFTDYAPRIWFGWLAEHETAMRAARSSFFQGKRVVMTGGTSGVGSQILRKILDRGAEVIVLGRDESKLARAVEGFEAQSRVSFIPCDLLEHDSIDSAIHELSAFEGIDVFIHSAGISVDRRLVDMSDSLEELNRMTQVNFVAPLRIIRSLIDQMRGGREARVVSLSSISTQVDASGFAAYSATKAALDQAFAVLTAELTGTGITFSSVRLPLVKSPMTHLNIRLRNVPMLSESSAAEMVIATAASGEPASGQPIGRLLELLKLTYPTLSPALSTIGWKLFLRLPYASRIVSATLNRPRR